MKQRLASLFVSAMLLAGSASAQQPAAPDAAVQSAATGATTQWLALADAGKWNETWDALAPAAQAKVPKATWTEQVGEVRGGLGTVKSRTLRSSVLMHQLPGAPAGDYVILSFETQFDAGLGLETIVPMRTADGSWKVSGYFIKECPDGKSCAAEPAKPATAAH